MAGSVVVRGFGYRRTGDVHRPNVIVTAPISGAVQDEAAKSVTLAVDLLDATVLTATLTEEVHTDIKTVDATVDVAVVNARVCCCPCGKLNCGGCCGDNDE